LAFWENGFRHLTNSKLVIKKVEDGKGLKIRTMENKVHLAAWKSAGFNPTPWPGERFRCDATGRDRRAGKPIAVYYTSKLWDAKQSNLSLTSHVYSPAPILMSKKIFDAMPKEDQKLFVETALEVAKFQRKINRDAEENRLKEVAGKGVTVVARRRSREFQEGYGACL